jgi:hypothetical protein
MKVLLTHYFNNSRKSEAVAQTQPLSGDNSPPFHKSSSEIKHIALGTWLANSSWLFPVKLLYEKSNYTSVIISYKEN